MGKHKYSREERIARARRLRKFMSVLHRKEQKRERMREQRILRSIKVKEAPRSARPGLHALRGERELISRREKPPLLDGVQPSISVKVSTR